MFGGRDNVELERILNLRVVCLSIKKLEAFYAHNPAHFELKLFEAANIFMDVKSEFVTVAQRHATAGTINAPTDTAIEFVCDVFKVNKDFGVIAKLDCATYAD